MAPDALASRGGAWHGGAMAPSPAPAPASGGILLALGPILGAAVGFVFGEATPGFLIGLALGAAAALLLWWRQRG